MTMPLRPSDLKTGASVDYSNVTEKTMHAFYGTFGKRAFDLALVVVLAPVAVLIVACVALYMQVTDGNPFYTQQRVGRNGRVFRIWKLRTMRQNADQVLKDMLAQDAGLRDEWNRTQKLKCDPRVTRLGTFLRKTSIDELPQLLNVAKGDMSMIGPRPMMVDQVALYGPDLPAYTSLRPGITGLWQVTERNNADFLRRAELDGVYARTLSFRTDLKIVVQTIKTILRSTGY